MRNEENPGAQPGHPEIESEAAFPESLNPEDWRRLRDQGHRMHDDVLDHVKHIRSSPVWQPAFELESVLAEFSHNEQLWFHIDGAYGALARLSADTAIHYDTFFTAPSTAIVIGELAIRAAIVNHRTRESDVDALRAAVVEADRRISGGTEPPG